MRKWIVPVVLVLVVVLAVAYFIWPNKGADKAVIRAEEQFAINAKAFSRAILNPFNWPQWWPEKDDQQQKPPAFSFHGNDYTVVQAKHSSLVIAVTHNKDTVITELVVIPAKPNTVHLFWTGAAQDASTTPARTFSKGWINKVDEDIETLLQKMEKHYSRDEKFYGRTIREESVVDSTFISTSTTLQSYPTTEDIYRMADKLKAFAEKNGAKQSGSPMLNISKLSQSSYLTRVAFPVDRAVQSEGDIQYRRMPAGGNILVTEVKGGPMQIENALQVMKQYVEDHGRLAPAIPYQSLITDRRSEPDTNKWITKVYWPVM